MSIEENKAIIRRFYESFGKEDSVRRIRKAENRETEAEKVIRTIFAETYALDCIMHASEGDRSVEEDIQDAVMYFTAFPDLRATVEDQIAEADKVVTRGPCMVLMRARCTVFPQQVSRSQ
jgi:deoxycytidylate deaminase